jgi:SPP1 gp7 family putative phage head morphogenesis protein
MVSNSIVNLAFTFANNRALFYLRKAYKTLRTELLEEGFQGKYINAMQQAILSCMVSAFVYGRLAVASQTKQIEKIQKQKNLIDDWSMPVDVIDVILKYDKQLLTSLFSKRQLTILYNEKDAMIQYFRPSAQALEFMKNYSFELASLQGRNIGRKAQLIVENIMQQGLGTRQASFELANKIRGLTLFRARAIAQTETTRSYNLGTITEAQTSEIVKGYVFNAVLDQRTTDICSERNGKFIPKDDISLIAENTPPLHVNCRSRLEIVTEFDTRQYPNLERLDVPESIQRRSDVEAVIETLFRM